MKAKYQHYGNDCIIYDQAICEDNIVVTVRSYYGSCVCKAPETNVKVCPTNSEAKRIFYNLCDSFDRKKYEMIYFVP